jgi:hypothetical protein
MGGGGDCQDGGKRLGTSVTGTGNWTETLLDKKKIKCDEKDKKEGKKYTGGSN